MPMNNSRIFVNPAVTDVKRSTEFFGRLGGHRPGVGSHRHLSGKCSRGA